RGGVLLGDKVEVTSAAIAVFSGTQRLIRRGRGGGESWKGAVMCAGLRVFGGVLIAVFANFRLGFHFGTDGIGSECVEEALGVENGEAANLDDVAAADGDGQHLLLEAGAAADGARPGGHVLLDILAGALGAVLVAAQEVRDDALEG